MKLQLDKPSCNLDTKFSVAVDEFIMKLKLAGASPSTIKLYRCALDSLKSYVGDIPIREIKEYDVLRWRASLIDSKSRSTARLYSLAVREFFEWINYPLCSSVPRQIKRLSVDFLTVDEIRKLIRVCKTEIDHLIVCLPIETGMRVRELLNIEARDVDPDRRAIVIRYAKWGGHRTVYYGPLSEPALVKRLRQVRSYDEKLVPYSYQFVWKRLKQLGRSAGIELRKIRPHVLRHTFATYALSSGVNIRILQSILGHKSISTTEIYTHVVDELMRRDYCEKFVPFLEQILLTMKS